MSTVFGFIGTNRSVLVWRQRLLTLGVGTLLAALLMVAGVAIYSYSNDDASQEKERIMAIATNPDSPFSSITLVTPIALIPKGAKISAAMLREITWPRRDVPEGALRSIADAENMFAAAPLVANHPLTQSHVTANPPSFGIGELLPPGHRAVTIEVNAVTGVEGWATPGAHVDVLLTYLEPEEGIQKTIVAVEDAVVLSYAGIAAKKLDQNQAERPTVNTTVTLAVPFEDSLKINTATAVGRITLSLRNSNDLTTQGKTEFSAKEWEKDLSKPKKKLDRFSANGFASFTDGEGKERQFVLDSDKRWKVNYGEEP